MAAPSRSFAARTVSRTSASSRLESWDDGDFADGDGLLFTSQATLGALSSRHSVRSDAESADDWQILLAPHDAPQATQAITTAAAHAGIPLPPNVPPSALLGGSIRRLGKKPPHTTAPAVDDDWGHDLELPQADGAPCLALKLPPAAAAQADAGDEADIDWGEGSLGIRFAGTRQARGARSSSVSASAMSPSLGSCMTADSDDDDLHGLVLPREPLDLHARLDQRKQASPQLPTPQTSPLPPPPTSAPHPCLAPDDDDDDFLQGLDVGDGCVFGDGKLTRHRHVVVKKPHATPPAPTAARPASTLTFTDKPASSRIPRPQPGSLRSRLTPVYETGAPTHGPRRPMPTTTSAQLLRSKRSAPALRSTHVASAAPRMPFLPPGGNATSTSIANNTATPPSHHAMARSSHGHLRRDSDPRRPQSPALRSHSRLSGHQVETPSRTSGRRDLAPSALARHPPPKKLTQPQRKRNFGDGHELDAFDDLPTSATKEKAFIKAPRHPPSTKTLRNQPSHSRLPMPDRMSTPLPHAPLSPPRHDHTPRFARDTAASRNAREQRLNDQRMAGTRSRAEGTVTARPMSWQAHVAARSPHSSPTAHRKKGSGAKPQLIRQMTQPSVHSRHTPCHAVSRISTDRILHR